LGAPDSPPLGLGDEPKGPLPTQPLGGIGDQPPTDPREAPDLDVTEEPSPIGEGEGLEEALGLAARDTEEEEPAQIHSALAPEPHDLEPYLPIGVGSEPSCCTRRRSLARSWPTMCSTPASTPIPMSARRSRPGFASNPDWSRHAFSAEINADRCWYNNYPIEDENNYQVLLRGRIDVTARTHLRAEAQTL
jgi:hypothetical protein